MGAEWVCDPLEKLQVTAAYGKGGLFTLTRHKGGVPWHKAPVPRRWHWCKPQTDGLTESARVQRCACGAVRDVYHGRWSPWVWKNTRRTARRDATPI